MLKDNFKMPLLYQIQDRNTLDRGLAYAESCFETWRVLNGDVFLLSKHQQRLQQAMRLLGWDVSLSVIQTWFDHAHQTAMQQGNDMLIRLSVSAGEAAWGLLPKQEPLLNVYVQTMPAMKRAPLHLQSVEWMFPRYEKIAKLSMDYGFELRAMQQWKENLKPPKQALICQNSEVMHSLTANVFLYRQGQWWTAKGLGILSGVVQGFLLEQGLVQGIVCPQAWLNDCEAMACSNSGVFLQPVQSINGRDLDVKHQALDALYAALSHEKGVVL
ncbi:MAG: aminotransferase class IV [Mariprofundaceae bacterium]|nr:aminotransferase class IV [Mariprofundaceae bacterium]